MIMESGLRLNSRWCRNGAGIVGATGSRVNGKKCPIRNASVKSHVANLEMHGKGNLYDPRFDDVDKYPVAANEAGP